MCPDSLQVGPHCQPLAGPDGQRDQELLEFMDQEEDPEASDEHDELVGDNGEPSVQHGGVGRGACWSPADAVQRGGRAPARRLPQPEPSLATAEDAGRLRRRPRVPAGGAVASALPLLHVRHERQRQPTIVADVAGGGDTPAAAPPVPHLHCGGDGRLADKLPSASLGGQHGNGHGSHGLRWSRRGKQRPLS